ncbi:MAG: DUF1444 family protein [Planctomycetaceae bacterium]
MPNPSDDSAHELPRDESSFVEFRGPANWFSFQMPRSLTSRQTEAFVEISPAGADASGDESSSRHRRWSMTLYAAWVEDSSPETQAASFDASALFPAVLHSKQATALTLQSPSKAWSGTSRGSRGGKWWRRMLTPRATYQWRLWIIEHREIMVVASLQSASGVPLDEDTIATCEAALNSITFADVLAKPPEVFRQDVMQLARRYFPLLKVEPAAGFSVRVQESEVNLANFYRSYLKRPERFEQIVLPGLTTVVRLQEWGQDQIMPPLDEVRDRIMPMLYPEDDADEGLTDFVRRPWVGGLVVMFVVDEDDTYRFVHRELLNRWQITPEELEQLAMRNLDRYSSDHPLKVTVVGDESDPRILVPLEPDAYNSARILGTQFHARMRELFGPELVVGVPNRDFFVAVSLDHPELIDHVRERVLQDYNSMHHPLTRRLLVISLDGVSEYSAT